MYKMSYQRLILGKNKSTLCKWVNFFFIDGNRKVVEDYEKKSQLYDHSFTQDSTIRDIDELNQNVKGDFVLIRTLKDTLS